MIVRLFRRRRSRTARLLEGSRAGMNRVRGALPGAELGDLFADLASRTGVDLTHQLSIKGELLNVAWEHVVSVDILSADCVRRGNTNCIRPERPYR